MTVPHSESNGFFMVALLFGIVDKFGRINGASIIKTSRLRKRRPRRRILGAC
jgi:hypothetical protein